MSAQPPTPLRAIPVADHNHDVARRVLRWLAVGGMVVGGAQLLTSLLTLAGWGLAWPPARSSVPLRVMYRVVVLLALLAPAVLIVGAIGLLRERRWAKPVLTVYAFLQIAGSLTGIVYGLMWRGDVLPNWTLAQQMMMVVSSLSTAILQCLVPAAVILCLVKPGVIQYAAPAGAAFQVLPAAAAASGPVPASAAKA